MSILGMDNMSQCVLGDPKYPKIGEKEKEYRKHFYF